MDCCGELIVEHPCGTLFLTGLVVLVSLLYYLYDRQLRECTFHVDGWGSYETERGIRCNKAIKDGKFVDSLDHENKGKGLVKTVYDCLMHGLEISRDEQCLGRMVDNLTRMEWITFREVDKISKIIGVFLRASGIKRQKAVGIYAANSVEWILTELGCVRQSIIAVPVYETLGLDSMRHTIKEVEMALLFCDSDVKLKKILDDREQFPALKAFVLLHDKPEDPAFGEKCKTKGVKFLTWSEANALGGKHPEIEDDPPKPEDILTIQYTSGTTGLSKGVILTHRNMVGYIAGGTAVTSLIASEGVQVLTKASTHLLYLPLAHAYGQMAAIWFMYIGAKTALSCGRPIRLMEDCQVIRPTYIPLVPRIMNRLYTMVLDQTKSGFKGWLFWKCYERKKALFKAGIFTRNSIYDWLVFRKLQNKIGGRVNFMTTASAPVAAEVLEFWRVVFGAVIVEAYGQTESTAAVTCAIDLNGNNVGHPLLCCMVRLLDLPELGYTTKHDPPQGEICIKGTNITQGYYKRPALTRETFTDDGWLLTGDIGEFLPDGSLRIIDRRKHLFKLSQGEYIAPEKVEAVYVQCPLVAQAFVDGSSLQTYIIAIVVPDEKEAKDWAREQGLTGVTLADLCTNEKFRLHVLNAMLELGKKHRLNSLEQIKSLYLFPEGFTIKNGLITPTLKNKRNDLRRCFKAEIDALYEAGPMIASAGRD